MFDISALDVVAFAAHKGSLQGTVSRSDLQRLSALTLPQPALSPLAWQVQGSMGVLRGTQQACLHVQIQGLLAMTCQRCLGPIDLPVNVERRLWFVPGEEAAEQEDTLTEDDVLPTSTALDLLELIEDELVLDLPWVPRHEVCPAPLPVPQDPSPEVSVHPFASLALLKKQDKT